MDVCRSNRTDFPPRISVRRSTGDRRHAAIRFPSWWTFGCILAAATFGAGFIRAADGVPASVISRERLEELLVPPTSDLRSSSFGVTRHGTPLRFWFSESDLDFAAPQFRILLVGGLDGSLESVEATRAAVDWFWSQPADSEVRRRFLISAAPCVNPDGMVAGRAPANDSGGTPATGYPPPGPAYTSTTDPEAAYLWRWMGLFAPDLIVEVRAGDRRQWHVASPTPAAELGAVARSLRELAPRLSAAAAPPARSLVDALARHAPAEVGLVPAVRVEHPGAGSEFLQELTAALVAVKFSHPSPARAELRRRTTRSAQEIASQLSRHFGHALPQVEYIPAVAMMGRLRLAAQTADADVLTDLERIVRPYYEKGKSSTPKSGSGQSGHLIFAALADAAAQDRRGRYVELVRVAADQMFDEQGQMTPVMPFHAEMSDAVFMGGPILAAAGRLTGESRYFDACLRHTRYMQNLVRRSDGLYRHSPLDESAWGRGNGFPALGLTLILSDLPAEHAARGELVQAVHDHLLALLKHQDPTGCWHQVIDHEESYRELTATSMITFAMLRGMRLGWLDRDRFEPAAARGWRAIQSRVGDQGRLVDVCTGTGKQKSLREYYDREALLGPDPRGGAMALLVATEQLDFEKSK